MKDGLLPKNRQQPVLFAILAVWDILTVKKGLLLGHPP